MKPSIEQMLECWKDCNEVTLSDSVKLVYNEEVEQGAAKWGSAHMFVADLVDTISKETSHWAVRYDHNPGVDHNTFRDGDLSNEDVFRVKSVTKTMNEWVVDNTM